MKTWESLPANLFWITYPTVYLGALSKRETMLGRVDILKKSDKNSVCFHSCRKDENHTHILQECHHDYNGNLVDTNTKKKFGLSVLSYWMAFTHLFVSQS